MHLASEKARLLAILLLISNGGVPTPVSAQDPPPTQTPATATTPPAASLSDPASLADDVRRRLRAARQIRGLKAKRAAFEQAIPAAERLAEQEPGPESLALLTVLRLGARRDPDALESARRWSAHDPDEARALLYLGMALSANQDYEAALAPFERVMALEPAEISKTTIARSLGFALERLDRFADALAVYENAGDESSAARIRQNIETRASLDEIDDGIVCVEPDLKREEAERLEEELKALEDPPRR